MKNRKIGFATCNRNQKISSIILAADLNTEVLGTADPRTVNGETSSKSSNEVGQLLASFAIKFALGWMILI